jgi:acetyltransferase
LEKPAVASGNKAKAQEILTKASDGFISQAAAFEILNAYGIPTPVTAQIIDGKIPAVAKFPAVLKVDSDKVVHKSDAGGVILNIKDDKALKEAVAQMARLFPGANLIVQEQCAQGTELIIGLKREPGVGPVLMFGLGGIYVEVLKDVAFRLAPVSEAGAARMVREIRSFQLLTGVRGTAASDVAAIERLLIAVSQMAIDLPEIAEMDLNPVFVYAQGQGVKAVDVRIRKEQAK